MCIRDRNVFVPELVLSGMCAAQADAGLVGAFTLQGTVANGSPYYMLSARTSARRLDHTGSDGGGSTGGGDTTTGCSNTCQYPQDGLCDDGGPGS
eukprot:6257869-Prymnesium_polylepis.1